MTFEIESFAKFKITDVVVLSQKNREPSDNPGAALQFAGTVSNDMLTMFDGSLRSLLYTKSAASNDADQGRLDVDVNEMPNCTKAGQKLGKLHWADELTGYSLEIDHGMGGKSNLALEDCEVSGFEFTAKEGGSVILGFKLESQNVSEKVFGKLATLKNREVQITLLPPEVETPPIV